MSHFKSTKPTFTIRDPITEALMPLLSYLRLLRAYGHELFVDEDIEKSERLIDNILFSDRSPWMIDFPLLRRGVARAIAISYERESRINRKELEDYEKALPYIEEQTKKTTVAHRVMHDHFESVALELLHETNSIRESDDVFNLLQKAHDFRGEYFRTANFNEVTAYLKELKALELDQKFQSLVRKQTSTAKGRKEKERQDELLLQLELLSLLNFEVS